MAICEETAASKAFSPEKCILCQHSAGVAAFALFFVYLDESPMTQSLLKYMEQMCLLTKVFGINPPWLGLI